MPFPKQIFHSDQKCLRKFIVNFGIKGALGLRKFRIRQKQGKIFPAFQFISVTNDCNLNCQGCWVTRGEKADRLDFQDICQIINESRKQGSNFFGILGGEPLMYKPLTDIFRTYPGCYFQLFTNGTLLTDKVAHELRQLGNVTPLISFEGDETVADIRRGGHEVYSKTLGAVRIAVKNRLIAGVAVSVCKSNIGMALSAEFVNMLIAEKVSYLWYYIYRPTGANPEYGLALSPDEVEKLRRFIVDARTQFGIAIIDAYWKDDGTPFCPAADGLSHHINPAGFIEPCPVVQFACENIKNGNLAETYENSAFLKDFKEKVAAKTRGCVLMEDPQWLAGFAQRHSALNTSNRENQLQQLSGSPVFCSHGSCPKIPEKSRIYRFFKKYAFFGLGAYG